MVNVVARQEALQALAERMLEIAPPNVIQVYGGFQAPAGEELHGAILGVVNHGGQWGFGQFDQDPVVYELVSDFYESCGEESWSTCEVKVDYTGELNVALGYDSLPDDGTMDAGLLDRLQRFNASFVEEYGASPRG